MTEITIDPDEIERSIMNLAKSGEWDAEGKPGGTGVWRTVYSPEWVAAADHYEALAQGAGLTARRDAVGNVWGRLEGSEGGKAIVSGSHIDTQTAGRPL